MKKTDGKKLVLNRETLANVAGGTTIPTQSRVGGCDIKSMLLTNCDTGKSRAPAICETQSRGIVCPTGTTTTR